MREVRDIAVFHSSRFKPILPDACQVGPRTYGAELAFWLAGKLAKQGVVTSYPVAADTGWMLSFAAAGGTVFQVLCANVDGSDTHWRLSLACDSPSLDAARDLVNAIRFVVHAAVPRADIDWRYRDAPAGQQALPSL